MSISPKDQHAIQASKILARRANSKNNTTGKQTPAKKAVKTTVAPTATEKKATTPVADPYAGKKRKELRAMCDARVPKIAYVKRDTIEQLIEKLKG